MCVTFFFSQKKKQPNWASLSGKLRFVCLLCRKAFDDESQRAACTSGHVTTDKDAMTTFLHAKTKLVLAINVVAHAKDFGRIPTPGQVLAMGDAKMEFHVARELAVGVGISSDLLDVCTDATFGKDFGAVAKRIEASLASFDALMAALTPPDIVCRPPRSPPAEPRVEPPRPSVEVTLESQRPPCLEDEPHGTLASTNVVRETTTAATMTTTALTVEPSVGVSSFVEANDFPNAQPTTKTAGRDHIADKPPGTCDPLKTVNPPTYDPFEDISAYDDPVNTTFPAVKAPAPAPAPKVETKAAECGSVADRFPVLCYPAVNSLPDDSPTFDDVTPELGTMEHGNDLYRFSTLDPDHDPLTDDTMGPADVMASNEATMVESETLGPPWIPRVPRRKPGLLGALDGLDIVPPDFGSSNAELAADATMIALEDPPELSSSPMGVEEYKEPPEEDNEPPNEDKEPPKEDKEPPEERGRSVFYPLAIQVGEMGEEDYRRVVAHKDVPVIVGRKKVLKAPGVTDPLITDAVHFIPPKHNDHKSLSRRVPYGRFLYLGASEVPAGEEAGFYFQIFNKKTGKPPVETRMSERGEEGERPEGDMFPTNPTWHIRAGSKNYDGPFFHPGLIRARPRDVICIGTALEMTLSDSTWTLDEPPEY